MKRFQKKCLRLVLAVIAFTAVPSHAQLVFQFEQQGLNTVITGSGSATTLQDKGNISVSERWIGFLDGPAFAPAPGEVLQTQAIPTNWVVSPTNEGGLLPADPASGIKALSSSLALQYAITNPLTYLGYTSGPSNQEGLAIWPNFYIPGSTAVTLSGQAVFGDPLTSLFDLYKPGTVLVILPGTLHYIIGIAPTPAGGGGGSRKQPQTVYLVDAGAMYSLEGSGLLTGLVVRDLSRSAANTALRGMNDRLKRASSRGLGQEAKVATTTSSSLLRYLAFTQDENMSYKVALGLADAEERTIAVNMVDTLSSQTGTNFNGQSLGGGLPYAMMGVPLMPMAGGAATVHIVEAAPSGKTVIDDSKAVVESASWKRWELFAAGDFSAYDQDQLSDLMEGFDTDSYAGSVGIEYRAKEWLNLGLAWSYLESDTNVSGNLGDIDLDGNLISGYATAFWRQYWTDILYSYGSFNSDINRNTGLGSTTRGDTDSDSHNVRLNFGRNIQVGGNVVTGPIAGLRYSNGDVDPYSETGGGTAALDYDGTEFESMVSRVGWQASHGRTTGWGRIISQVHVAWEHEYMPENGTVGAGLQTSPFAAVTGGSVRRFGGFSSESEGGHPGTDWMSAGAGLRFELENGFAIRTDYEGAFFRNNASQHYASAKVSYEW